MGRLVRTLCAAGLLLATAPPAQAGPVALLDAPRAQDVALSGAEVVIGSSAAGAGIRVDAVPVTGGPRRPLLSARGPRGSRGTMRVVASSGVVAALAYFDRDDGTAEFRVYAGPPTGTLTLRERVPATTGSWLPVDVDADADRLLLTEGRLPALRFRARMLTPGGGAEPVPWSGSFVQAVLAGEHVALVGSRRSGPDAPVNRVFVVERGTGSVQAEVKLRPSEDVEEGDLDLAPDGRVLVAADGSILTAAPGAPQTRLPGDGFTQPRFSAGGIVALQDGRFSARRPVVLDPGAAARELGGPSADLELLEADDRGVAWVANGCVLYAERDGAAVAEPPAGPCPRAEVLYEEGDQTLRGRRLRVIITCVTAPAAGCRGTALLGRRGVFGRAPFRLAAGTRRTVAIELSERGMRRVRRARRRYDFAIFSLAARVRDGRAHGTSGVLVARTR